VAKAKEASASATMERRGAKDRRNKKPDRRHASIPVAIERRQVERRKVPRRRQIDPTTCERDYTDAEIEFMNALDDYKRRSGRMFPTCSEILEVVRGLGYEKRPMPRPDAAATLAEPLAAPTATSLGGEPPPGGKRGSDDGLPCDRRTPSRPNN
jgi:hypothetical protein